MSDIKNRSVGYAIAAIIFFSCTAYISGQTFDAVQTNVFKIGIPVLWILSLSIKQKRSVCDKWISALVGFTFLTVLMLKGDPQNVAIEPLVSLFLVTVLYFTLSQYLDNIKPILNGICWAVGFQAVIVLLQGLGMDPVCINDSRTAINTHFVGLYGYKFVFGAWMAIVTPILLFNKRYIFGALSFVMAILSMSIAPIGLMMLALVIGALMLNRKYTKLVIICALIIAAVAWCVVLNKPSNQSLYQKAWLRVTLESKFLPIVFQKPLTGWGLGSFKFIGPQVWNPSTGPYGTMIDAWNDWLEKSVECGIPFIVLFGGLCLSVLKRFRAAKKSPALVGSFCSLAIIPVGMVFHNYMGHASLAILMTCIFAAFTIRSHDEVVSA